MGKCRACEDNLCGRKYENRSECEDRAHCTCTCQEDETDTVVKGCLSGIIGAAAFAGGVVLTVTTGGIGAIGVAAVIGGSALSGFGATAAIHPVARKISGERITAKEYTKDLAIGTVSGLVTGGIGSVGSSVTTTAAREVGKRYFAQGFVKLTARTLTGAIVGGASSSIQDVASNGEIDFSNFVRNCAIGAATGGVGHISGNLVNRVAGSGIERSLMRVGTDLIEATAIDCGSQLIGSKKIDPSTLLINVGARTVMSAASESIKNATYLANGGKEKMIRNSQYKYEQVSKTIRDEIEDAVRLFDEIPTCKIKDELEKVENRQTLLGKRTKLFKMKDNLDRKLKQKVCERNEAVKRTHDTVAEKRNVMQPIQEDIKRLSKLSAQNANQIKKNDLELANSQSELIGERNIHVLQKRSNQIAADLKDEKNVGRGLNRVVFDINKRSKTTYAGHTLEHRYQDIPIKSETGPLIEERWKTKPYIRYEQNEEKDEGKGKNE